MAIKAGHFALLTRLLPAAKKDRDELLSTGKDDHQRSSSLQPRRSTGIRRLTNVKTV
jgi:hypothetical protein